jgi:CheY-like chemotaxis protein
MTVHTPEQLSGLRVLVVEDSYVIACNVRQMLLDLGCSVLGPVSSVRAAMQLLDRGGCNAAILDINLGVETSAPIAARLEQDQTPFILVSGYASPTLPEGSFNTHRRLHKPITLDTLRDAVLADFVRNA